MALPMACSEEDSRDAASRRASSLPIPIPSTSVSRGRPRVSVPVLSNRTHRTRDACSRTSPPRTRIPLACAEVVPTRTASGVARPRAHGQAMTSTEIPAISAAWGGIPPCSRNRIVPAATSTIEGTKPRTTRSAMRWIGALRACASSTACTMRDRTVSAPVRATRTRRRPVPFSAPATTVSPAVFGTGADSPDRRASSASDAPSTTFPSTGIRSPGTTSTRSPAAREATGTSAVPPPSTAFRAVTGASRTSREIPSAARALAPASMYRPRRTKVRIIVAVSKYTSPPRTREAVL